MLLGPGGMQLCSGLNAAHRERADFLPSVGCVVMRVEKEDRAGVGRL